MQHLADVESQAAPTSAHSRHVAPVAAGPRQPLPLGTVPVDAARAAQRRPVHARPVAGTGRPPTDTASKSQLHAPPVSTDVTHTVCKGGSAVVLRQMSRASGSHWSSRLQVASLGARGSSKGRQVPATHVTRSPYWLASVLPVSVSHEAPTGRSWTHTVLEPMPGYLHTGTPANGQWKCRWYSTVAAGA